ncbi:hypothetical protein N7510_000817 [Penicillium lagena]|uniref:uncharacterized protein n=1 Tax=Penicillium lagena TaxID=94218 RepID=UPI002540A529|nr:uncharacterized protein N7510_000817 [Penicillium lagena]KAJ5624508.1 hypothetical protein N7510_000817 [Penicillium lagena]
MPSAIKSVATVAVLSLAALGEAGLIHDGLIHRGTSNNSTLPHGQNSTSCIPLTDATQQDWQDANTNSWLSNWLKTNADAISKSGFISAFGELVLGQTGWTCELGENCTLPCLKRTPSTIKHAHLQARDTSQGSATQQAANVGSSLVNLNEAFNEMQTLFNSAVGETNSALDGIIGDFWFEADTSSLDLANGLHALGIVLGLVASFATGGAAAPAAALSTLFAGGVTEALSVLPSEDPYMVQAGNAGVQMSQIYQALDQAIQNLYNNITSGNNDDIASVFSDGTFLLEHSADITQNITDVFESSIINYVWREQMVFILGGSDCAEDQGIGNTGPKDDNGIIWWCDENNKAWYLYFYQFNNNGVPGKGSQNTDAWIAHPWGSDRMGNNPSLQAGGGTGNFYTWLNPYNAVISSVKSWQVAGNNYTTQTWEERMKGIISGGHNPLFDGNAIEGLWTIPVCNISAAVDQNYPGKSNILQPYGSRSVEWCGPICDNDDDTTLEFFKAANMVFDGFEKSDYPFVQSCPDHTTT